MQRRRRAGSLLPTQGGAPATVLPLLDRARRFERIYRRYHSDIRRLCARLIGDRDRAEDLAQETFVRAFRHLDGFQDGQSYWPWLSTIARRLCVDELRSRHIRPTPLDNVALESGRANTSIDSTYEQVQSRIESALLQTALTRALARLDPRQRRILQWRAEGRSLHEIAGLERTTIDAVRNTAWRARAIVRSMLDTASEGRLAGLALGSFRWLRDAARRIRLKMAQLTGSPASEAGPLLDRVALAVAGIVAATVLFASAGDGRGPVAPEAFVPRLDFPSVDRRAEAAPPHAGIGSRQEFPTTTTRGGREVDVVRTSITTGKTRDHGAVPSSGYVRVEVAGPNGDVLVAYEEEYQCSRNGEDVLPDRGPVRVVC
jgi:RNA polymerase sigma-70 factor (ECF subfamily)